MQRLNNQRPRNGRYVKAGYAYDEKSSNLYIADVTPGSRQDTLRDKNRKGYTRRMSPEPVLMGRPEETRKHAYGKKEGPLDILVREVKRDRLGAGAAAILAATFLILMVLFLGELSRQNALKTEIAAYNQRITELVTENDGLTEQLARARDGQRIRNLAGNELHMLRREKATVKEIYIQLPEDDSLLTGAKDSEPHLEMLDIMLGLLDRFHIGE